MANNELMKYIYVLFALAFLNICPTSIACAGSYEIDVGYWTNRDSYYPNKETNVVPRVLNSENSSFRFGYVIKHKHGMSFRHYDIVYLPSPPEEFGMDFKNKPYLFSIDKSRKKVVRKERIIPINSIVPRKWGFSKGDPLGIYKIEIYVNGRLEETIEYEVVAPKNE